MKTGDHLRFSRLNKPAQEQQSFTQNQPLFYKSEFTDWEKPQGKWEKFWEMVRRRVVIIMGATAAVSAGTLVWTGHQTPEYEGSFQLLVEPLAEMGFSSVPPLNRDPNASNLSLDGDAKIDPLASTLTQPQDIPAPQSSLGPQVANFDYDSHIKVLQSPQLMATLIKPLQTQYPDINYNSLFAKSISGSPFAQDRLSIRRLHQTKILEVRYRDADPKKIQFVLEQLAQGYVNYSRDNRQLNQIQANLKFIDAQVQPLKSRVDTIQREIQGLQQDYQFIDPQIQTQQLTQQMGQLQTQILDNQSQLHQQESLYKMLQAQLGFTQEQALTASALTQAPRYQALLNQLQEVETKIAIELSRFKENTPQIQVLYDQHKNLLPVLKEEAARVLGQNIENVDPKVLRYQDSIRLDMTQKLMGTANQIQVLGVRDKVLNEAMRRLNEYSQKFPEALRRYTTLQRELEITTHQLKNWLKQEETWQLQSVGQQELAWDLIAKPTLVKDTHGILVNVSPNLPLNLALGSMAGLALGLLIAQWVDRRHYKVFQSPDDMKEAMTLPLLGVIPASPSALVPKFTPELEPLTWDSMPLDAFSEAFRTLNANLRFLGFDNPIRSCVISSATPADGKSTIAANLAKAAAAMGQRVLLVDADLRRPQIHSHFRLSNKRGLSHVITNNLEVEAAIQRAHRWGNAAVDDNLFVMTAGAMPPDPARLLASHKMQQLMAQLTEKFDLVIYDTPPLLGLADASLLTAYTDGMMLVIGLKKTERMALMLTLEALQTTGVSILGMVANGDPENSSYQRYYSQQYYLEPQPETWKNEESEGDHWNQ